MTEELKALVNYRIAQADEAVMEAGRCILNSYA